MIHTDHIFDAAVKTEATPTKLAGGVTVTRDAPNAVGCHDADGDPTGASMPHVKAEAPNGPKSAPAFLNCSIKEEREAALEEPLAEALLQGLAPFPLLQCMALLVTWHLNICPSVSCTERKLSALRM